MAAAATSRRDLNVYAEHRRDETSLLWETSISAKQIKKADPPSRLIGPLGVTCIRLMEGIAQPESRPLGIPE